MAMPHRPLNKAHIDPNRNAGQDHPALTALRLPSSSTRTSNVLNFSSPLCIVHTDSPAGSVDRREHRNTPPAYSPRVLYFAGRPTVAELPVFAADCGLPLPIKVGAAIGLLLSVGPRVHAPRSKRCQCASFPWFNYPRTGLFSPTCIERHDLRASRSTIAIAAPCVHERHTLAGLTARRCEISRT